MFDKKLTSLELRKQLLVAESEVNRTLLVVEYQNLAGHIRAATQPVRYLTSLVSALLALSNAVRERKSVAAGPKRFWSSAFLFRLGLALWKSLAGNRN